jgi:hypothetical protein
MLDNFYFTHLNIDNYEEMVADTRLYILEKIKSIPNSGFSLLPDNQEFIDNCKLFSKWVNDNQLEVSRVAVHILEPNTTGHLHIDGFSDVSTLAVNLNMQNCEGTQTKFFEVSVPGKKYRTLNGALEYTVFDFDDNTCKEVAYYDLEKPVLFNISKPHRVYNLQDTKRISLSVRFVNHPIDLI